VRSRVEKQRISRIRAFLAKLSSDLRTIGQLGTTVCIGLLLDTLIVRSFVVPCILRILGPWFWWPTLVRTRPLPQR
jgi:putative drug exporter of the RND superfamily